MIYNREFEILELSDKISELQQGSADGLWEQGVSKNADFLAFATREGRRDLIDRFKYDCTSEEEMIELTRDMTKMEKKQAIEYRNIEFYALYDYFADFYNSTIEIIDKKDDIETRRDKRAHNAMVRKKIELIKEVLLERFDFSRMPARK